MVKLSEIRALIDAYIKTNGNQEITGHTMNVLLNEIVRILDERKQDVLVSGENIKTIGGMSLLGEGDIDIPGYDDTEIRNLINAVVTAVEDQNGKIAEVAGSVQEQGKKLTELSEANEVLKEAQQFTDVAIKDLQDMKIDRENDDYYPKMAVGLADNLAGVDVVDSEINFRRSGGGAITDGVARVQSIKGNSVVWNQGFKKGVNQKGEVWDNNLITINEETTTAYEEYDNIADAKRGLISHKYLQEVVKVSGTVSQGSIKWYSYAFGGVVVIDSNTPNGVIMQKIGSIIYDNAYWSYRHYEANTIANGLIIRQIVYDLTLMFGAGNEPTTIEEFYARIPMGVDLNAYNEGEVIHMDVQSIESVGVNLWDEEWEVGSFNTTTGADISRADQIRSKNLIKVLPNTDYYIKTPANAWILMHDKEGNVIEGYKGGNTQDGNAIGVYASVAKFKTAPNAYYLKFYLLNTYGATYNHDVCINLSDASINGKYFPYIKRVEDLSLIHKYFPDGMKSAGSAHDEIRYNKASGKWEYSKGRVKSVDLGTLNWVYNPISDSYPHGYFFNASLNKAIGNSNLLTAKYDNSVDWKSVGIRGSESNNRIYIKDSAYTDAASFKAAMQGIILYYEAADWEWEELDAEDQFKDLDYQVWNGGTEKAIAEGKSSPLAADITYGFNAIGKIKELEEAIKALQTTVASL